MVNYSSSFLFGRWTFKRFEATIINDIWPEVTFFSLIATMVALVSDHTKHKLVISNQLLTVLGTVLGLVISFRTSSAYERYQDGRKMWTSITVASRNLAQLFWIHVPDEREGKEALKGITPLQNIVEKKSMVNLVSAFSVAVKHHLRNEPGIYYEDLYPLISFLPRYASGPPELQTEDDMLPLWKASEDEHMHLTGAKPAPLSRHPSGAGVISTDGSNDDADEKEKEGISWSYSLKGKKVSKKRKKFDPEAVLPIVTPERPLRPARNPPQSDFYDYFPIFRLFRFVFRGFKRRVRSPENERDILGRRHKRRIVESNVPLEITLYLQSYNAWLLRHNLLMPAAATGIINNLASFQDTMANLERIGNTPLPFAYQAHLRMTLWFYLFLLPFQLYTAFKYITIPATAFTAFFLIGFLEIGAEIENPFNYDENDLDLDEFCLAIARDLQLTTAHISPDPDTYLFSAWNQPFAPGDRRSAMDLTNGGERYYVPQREHKGAGDEIGEVARAEREKGLQSLRRTLLRSWREVDIETRK